MIYRVKVRRNLNRSTDSLTGSPSFTISTKRDAEGKYVATCDSLPDIKTCVDTDEAEAIRGVRRLVEEYVLKGGR